MRIDLELSAERLARKAHSGQTRDGGEPYITHPERVVHLLKIYGYVTDEEVLAVGWLHDVIEDTHYSLLKIKEDFGRDVAFGIALLTKTSKAREEMVESLHKHRNSRFIVVKLADRLANLQTMRVWSNERQSSYAVGALGILWAVPRKLAPTLWDELFVTATKVLAPQLTVRAVPKEDPKLTIVEDQSWLARFLRWLPWSETWDYT